MKTTPTAETPFRLILKNNLVETLIKRVFDYDKVYPLHGFNASLANDDWNILYTSEMEGNEYQMVDLHGKPVLSFRALNVFTTDETTEIVGIIDTDLCNPDSVLEVDSDLMCLQILRLR